MTNGRHSFASHISTFAVAGLVGLGFLFGILTWSGAAPWDSGYEVRVIVPNAGTMGPGASVQIAGVRVGKVASVTRDGAYTRLSLTISGARTPLPADSLVQVRLRSLVGENYIELFPGHSSKTLPSGGTLPISQVKNYVEADQILSVLRGQNGVRARQLTQGFGSALNGQGGRLNAFLGASAGAIQAAPNVTSVLANDHQQVAGLVQDVGTVMRAIGQRSSSIMQLSSAGRQMFEALANRDLSLQQTLLQLPSTLQQVRTTTGLLQNVTGRVAPVLANLAVAVNELSPVFHDLGPATVQGRQVLAQLQTTAPRLQGLLGRLETLAAPTVAAMPALHKTLCQLNPMAGYLSPYATDLADMLTNMASATSYYDSTGHAARFFAIIGQNSFTALPNAAKDALNTLENIGIVNKLTERGYQPYSPPGLANHPTGGAGASGPADPTSYRYPHVVAAC
ncbi:MAG: MlaD family protein [Solirubrobacteraceae bacterium]